MTTPSNYDENKIISTWDELDIPENVLRGIYSYGFERPSNIQQKAVYPILCKRDVIAQAQSGTGKTGTFTIGSLSRIDTTINQTQIMVLAPTHELAYQISDVFNAIGQYIPNFSSRAFVGGKSVREDIDAINARPPIVAVGCPGRIADLIKKRVLITDYVKILVIDEADEMLSHGFQEQVKNIFQYLPETVQAAIFSATMNREVMDISSRFMINPVKIVMEADKLSLDGIGQYYVTVRDDGDKYDLLMQLLSKLTISQCIIYCNSINRVKQLYDAMQRDGFSVCCIHRDMTKSEREKSFQTLRAGGCRFMISSNITARGIDVQQINLVINFDITKDVHTYLHRIGRSGRWGRKGTAINFLTRFDMRTKDDLENYYRTVIQALPEDLGRL
jgi:translation initiation factor 4A